MIQIPPLINLYMSRAGGSECKKATLNNTSLATMSAQPCDYISCNVRSREWRSHLNYGRKVTRDHGISVTLVSKHELLMSKHETGSWRQPEEGDMSVI